MPRQIPILAALIVCTTLPSQAAGPAFVAGSGYNAGVEGQPLVWANAAVQYYTDQGDLSPILPGAQADALVAAAFGTWTNIPSVTLNASQAGHLAEDVNGGNIAVGSNGVITAPTDITPSATTTPVAIVYDYDGTVTDALLGEGAGGLDDCFTNAVYGDADNFAAAGNIAHALVVINGVCATTTSQLPDVQYRLVRVLGHILGLGWSQANLNVITRNPIPTSDDFSGFPVMHYADPISCVPITACYPEPATPKMDDVNSITRLYPNQTNSQPTGRIYGSLYFTDASGNAAQPMQGVNVVARLLDAAGQPSRQFVATSVSGFAYLGNAGNIIDGYVDANGLRFDRWGSNDATLEGFFDLGQLAIPAGQDIALYQLSVEALGPDWSLGVQPYGPNQVSPSGSFVPVVVTIQSGSDVERDILMAQSEIAEEHPGSGSTYAKPVALPQSGSWGSWISGYGSADFFQFTAQLNRTASVSVLALDETGVPTESKLMPVIGMWQLSDETGNPAPAQTPSAFNSTTFGMTRLDAEFNVTNTFRLAVADYRGDGRPDYFYQARLLYSDSLTPPRISLAGGLTTLNGIGFRPGLQVSVNGNTADSVSASASQIAAILPAAPQDGTATVLISDPVTGGFSQMTNALTYGALSTDLLLLLQGSEPAAPIGAPAQNPIRVRAVASDGVTPVNGATVAWSGNSGLLLSACGGKSSCSVLTDQAGESSSWVTPEVTGVSTVTIALAPASYAPPQTQQATVVGTSSALDLVALDPTRWIAQGASFAVPLTAEVLDLGVPQANVLVNFRLVRGWATLSSNSGTTNSSGQATIAAQITNQSANVQVTACVAPNNAPCQTFTMFSTPSSSWKLETVSGSAQAVQTGQMFVPLVMRVTDGTPTANPVTGVNVTLTTTLARGGPDPIILGSSQVVLLTDQNGLASITPSVGNVGPCDVFVAVAAGSQTVQFQMESVPAISVDQPKRGPLANPPQPVRQRFDANFDSPAPVAPAAMIFAVPAGIPLADPVVTNDPESQPAIDEKGEIKDDQSPPATATPLPTKPAVPPSATPITKTGPRKTVLPTPASDETGVKKKAALDPVSAGLFVSLINDKRSCRFALDETVLNYGMKTSVP